MQRRKFLLAAAGAASAFAATGAAGATVLYDDRATRLDKVRPDPQDLWVRSADLPRINGFAVKPQGACRADICIPLSKDLRHGEFLNLTGFARKVRQTFVADAGVWSFGEIPVVRGGFYRTRMAPDFAVPDRRGRTVHLSDFRGKKVLVITWASW
jgi:hypothetical protein